MRQFVYEDFLPPPDSFWSPVSVTTRPFWCTPHPHRVFAWTFLSALSPPPQLLLSGTWAYHLPGFWGTVSFPLAFLLVSAPLTEPRPFPGGPLQLQEKSEWGGRGWCSGSWVLPRTARDQGSGNQCACLGFCLRLPPSQLLPAQETQLSPPLGSPPDCSQGAQRLSSDHRAYIQVFNFSLPFHLPHSKSRNLDPGFLTPATQAPAEAQAKVNVFQTV